MGPAPFTAVARVVKTHGALGELSCAELEGPLSELPCGLELWFVPPAERVRGAVLTSVRQGPKGPLVKVEGVDSPEDARTLSGCLLLARTSHLPSGWLLEDAPDHRGLRVSDADHGFLGTVTRVIVTGANDVWVVTGGPLGEILLPVIDDVVLAVDETQRSARVRLLPGLIEEG